MSTKVFKKDVVSVTGTGKSEHMPKGKKFRVHQLAADKLKAAGKAE